LTLQVSDRHWLGRLSRAAPTHCGTPRECASDSRSHQAAIEMLGHQLAPLQIRAMMCGLMALVQRCNAG
jgi:hypothetical protein